MANSKPQPIQPEDLLLIKAIADVQLSPDGSRIAYTLTEMDAEKDKYRTSIGNLYYAS